ncbi:hypothetical protein H4K36_01255 [Streptomyces sp. DHE7-1]|nr:hypothetical protein [Streptomyces sp. DHE7-1]
MKPPCPGWPSPSLPPRFTSSASRLLPDRATRDI